MENAEKKRVVVRKNATRDVWIKRAYDAEFELLELKIAHEKAIEELHEYRTMKFWKRLTRLFG